MTGMLKQAVEARDHYAIREWIRQQNSAWEALPDGPKGGREPVLPQSRIEQINIGQWPSALDYPNWSAPHNYDALVQFLQSKFVDGRASDLSEYLQAIAAQILDGSIRRKGKPTGPEPKAIRVLALKCIDELRAAGMTANLGPDWQSEERFTAVQLVAEALEQSEHTVDKWWQHYLKDQKQWDG